MNELQRCLVERNVVVIDGNEINESLADYIHEAFLHFIVQGIPDITIFFKSDGGSVDNGLTIFDIIRLYPGKKTGIVLGFASSMAVVILQACSVRKCAKHAIIQIHNVGFCTERMPLEDVQNKKKMREIRTSLEDLQKLMNEILIERTGKSEEFIKKQLKEGKGLSAEKALEFGLIDDII